MTEAAAKVRAPCRDDLPAIARIAEAAGLFAADMLPTMIVDHLTGSDKQVWLVVEDAGAVQGFAFAEPEPLTDRTWNLRAIGIDLARQRLGLATTLLSRVEAALRHRTVRLLIIETTDGDDQHAARAFTDGAVTATRRLSVTSGRLASQSLSSQRPCRHRIVDPEVDVQGITAFSETGRLFMLKLG